MPNIIKTPTPNSTAFQYVVEAVNLTFGDQFKIFLIIIVLMFLAYNHSFWIRVQMKVQGLESKLDALETLLQKMINDHTNSGK